MSSILIAPMDDFLFKKSLRNYRIVRNEKIFYPSSSHELKDLSCAMVAVEEEEDKVTMLLSDLSSDELKLVHMKQRDEQWDTYIRPLNLHTNNLVMEDVKFKSNQTISAFVFKDDNGKHKVAIVDMKVNLFDTFDFGDTADLKIVISDDNLTVAIGDPSHHGNTGRLIVYHRPMYNWMLDSHFKYRPDIHDCFGGSLDISEDGKMLVLGIPNKIVDNKTAGCVIVFKKHGHFWLKQKELISPKGLEWMGEFGREVSMTDNKLTIKDKNNEYQWNHEHGSWSLVDGSE